LLGSKLNPQEAQLLHQLYLSLTMPASYQESLDDRISKTVAELTKLIQAGAPGKSENEKLSFNQQSSYHDLKQII